jgi:cobalt-zinc-cadmium efflux system outer membrane protein
MEVFPMRQLAWRTCAAVLVACCLTTLASAQSRSYTWSQLRDKFEASNPTLLAGQINVNESKAGEVTANVRPNPDLSVSLDQFQPFTGNPYRPLTNLVPTVSLSYLYERNNRRDLRLDSARAGTLVTQTQQDDVKRNLLFNLRNAFVQTLQAKAVLALAQENLDYYDRVLGVSRSQLQAGGIAKIDMDRLELQRVQFESDQQTALVNLRTAKIQLLTLLNDRTPVEQFDVTGLFEPVDNLMPLEQLRSAALDSRPDLKAATGAIAKAKIDHNLAVSSGSTDPTFGFDAGHNPGEFIGFSVSIPLRVFDKNQGEKTRTQLDIQLNERLRDAAEAQVLSDVDSAYATLNSNMTLLQSYKTKYLAIAVSVRDTSLFAYQRGGASLLDFLQSQNDYRSVQLNYLNLIGSYMTAASQLNLAVGSEVIP